MNCSTVWNFGIWMTVINSRKSQYAIKDVLWAIWRDIPIDAANIGNAQCFSDWKDKTKIIIDSFVENGQSLNKYAVKSNHSVIRFCEKIQTNKSSHYAFGCGISLHLLVCKWQKEPDQYQVYLIYLSFSDLLVIEQLILVHLIYMYIVNFIHLHCILMVYHLLVSCHPLRSNKEKQLIAFMADLVCPFAIHFLKLRIWICYSCDCVCVI